MVFFSGHLLISHSLIQSAESLSLDPFANERLSTELKNAKKTQDVVNALYANLFTEQNEYFSSGDKWYQKDATVVQETVKKRFIGYLVGGDDAANVKNRAKDVFDVIGIQGGYEGLDFSGTKLEGNKLIISVKYKQEFVFNFQGLAAFDREQRIVVTMWDI